MRRARTLFVSSAVAAAVALVGAGCGGGGPRLSREAMIARADRVCERGFAAAEGLRGTADPGARGEAAAGEIAAAREVLRVQVAAFAHLRGPEESDGDLAQAVGSLRAADAGLRVLERRVVRDDLTVDEAIRSDPRLVTRINRDSGRAERALVRLGFLGCVAASAGG